jgi:rhomboid family GlyGly-CTERM serine protease
MRRPLNRSYAGSILCLLGITALALLAMTLPPDWQQGLEFQYRAIGEGELWRLISGHLVHLGGEHLLMNLLGLWLIWALLLRFKTGPNCALAFFLLTLGTSLCLYLLSPEIAWYQGLSGVLHGLLVWALLSQWQSSPGTHGVILGLVACKLTWEQVSGPLPGSSELVRGRIIVEAHLYGALSGALLWALQSAKGKFAMGRKMQS